jgi:hypothetical protein
LGFETGQAIIALFVVNHSLKHTTLCSHRAPEIQGHRHEKLSKTKPTENGPRDAKTKTTQSITLGDLKIQIFLHDGLPQNIT